MKNTRKKQNLKKRPSFTRKGGFFNFFKKKPKSTQDELNNLQRILQNTSLKNIEIMFRKEIVLLKKKREQCIFNCKNRSMEYNDAELRNQLNSMMDTKSDYEWGNLCANSINVIDCSDYLKSYKKIEFYKNYLDQINKNIQLLFDNYKSTNEQKINAIYSPPKNSEFSNPINYNSNQINSNPNNSYSTDTTTSSLLEKDA